VLKFLGLSFANTKTATIARPPTTRRGVKIIPTPERSQLGYPKELGWCSPTSISMVLARWAEILHRPEMNLTVPEVAAKVYDDSFAARATGRSTPRSPAALVACEATSRGWMTYQKSRIGLPRASR